MNGQTTLQAPHPPSTISSKIMCVVFHGGNRHPSIPPVPSGTYVGPTVLPTRSDVTETTTKRSEKDKSDENGRPLGVLVETEQPEQQKLRSVVEEGGKWLINHSPTNKSPQDFSSPSLVPKTTRFVSTGGNHHHHNPPPPSLVLRTMWFASSGDNHHHLTPPGPPQSQPPLDSNRTTERGCKPTSMLMRIRCSEVRKQTL